MNDGFYKLLITDGLGCTYSYPLVIGQTTGIKEQSLGYSASLFPNPSSGKIELSLNDPRYNSTLEVIDAIGRKVYQTTVSSNLSTLNLEFLSEGIYNVKISNGLGIIYKKIIIKK